MPDDFVTFSSSAAYAIPPHDDRILFIKRPANSAVRLSYIANFAEQLRRSLGEGRGDASPAREHHDYLAAKV